MPQVDLQNQLCYGARMVKNRNKISFLLFGAVFLTGQVAGFLLNAFGWSSDWF